MQHYVETFFIRSFLHDLVQHHCCKYETQLCKNFVLITCSQCYVCDPALSTFKLYSAQTVSSCDRDNIQSITLRHSTVIMILKLLF